MEHRTGKRGQFYLIAVEVMRQDWVADWHARCVQEFVASRGLRGYLSLSEALNGLCELIEAMEDEGLAVERQMSDQEFMGFTLNNGGVLVAAKLTE